MQTKHTNKEVTGTNVCSLLSFNMVYYCLVIEFAIPGVPEVKNVWLLVTQYTYKSLPAFQSGRDDRVQGADVRGGTLWALLRQYNIISTLKKKHCHYSNKCCRPNMQVLVQASNENTGNKFLFNPLKKMAKTALRLKGQFTPK